MAKRTTATAEMVEFEFEVTKEDFDNLNTYVYDEDDGLVALAFKRQFPQEKFVRAHGDYYIGLGDDDDYERYLFDPESQELIHTFKNEMDFPESVTLRVQGARETSREEVVV